MWTWGGEDNCLLFLKQNKRRHRRFEGFRRLTASESHFWTSFFIAYLLHVHILCRPSLRTEEADGIAGGRGPLQPLDPGSEHSRGVGVRGAGARDLGRRRS